MKKNFESPIIKVIVFESQDILAAGSSEADAGGNSGGAFWSGCY